MRSPPHFLSRPSARHRRSGLQLQTQILMTDDASAFKLTVSFSENFLYIGTISKLKMVSTLGDIVNLLIGLTPAQQATIGRNDQGLYIVKVV